MSRYLCVSIRFADPEPAFRGRGDGGEPEWPPSPLRAFQALVAAAAARFGNPAQFLDYARLAFEWLGGLGAPVVYAPPGERGTPFRTAVPNNDMDIVAAAWAKRAEPPKQPSQLKALKTVQPTHLRGNGGDLALHYVWPVPDEQAPAFAHHREFLFATARSVVALGWGVDMAFGCGRELDEAGVAQLKGERWSPVATGGSVRVPTSKTFAALVERHGEFQQQLHRGGYSPVPPLTAFDTVGYRRDTDIAPRPWAAFAILKPDQSGNRSFDTACRCRDVAAWVRHATGTVCADWPDVAAFVHGHAEATNPLRGERADERFMYLPLPTINSKLNRVESIRRVLVAAPAGFRDRIEWIRRRLPGQELVWDGEAVGLLNLLPTSDWVLRQYTGTACVWSTVTPVVLPGHDDRDSAKAEGLLRRALAHAGFPSTEAQGTAVEFRGVGFRSGVDLASQYATSEHTKGPRYHVRVRFAHAVTGPVVVGNGRYRGFGLFATE